MNVVLYDDIWEVGFLDSCFSLQSVVTDQYLNIMVWNNTAGIGIFIKFANTEFTDEARSSNTECFSSYGNIFTSGFLPSFFEDWVFSVVNGSVSFLIHDEIVSSFSHILLFLCLWKSCFLCIFQAVSPSPFNELFINDCCFYRIENWQCWQMCSFTFNFGCRCGLHLQSCQCLVLFPKVFDSLRLLVFNWQVSISLIMQSSIVPPLFSDSLPRTIINENCKSKQAIHNQKSKLGDQKSPIISKEALHHNYTFA